MKLLTPRQAIICAAIAEGAGGYPAIWPYPARKEDVIGWAASYGPTGSQSDLGRAFETLHGERLFHRVMHPAFTSAHYYPSYWAEFVSELPEDTHEHIPFFSWTMPGSSQLERTARGSLIELWEATFEELSHEWGVAWMFFGMCTGQGAEGPSDAPSGPCLGHSCCDAKRGSRECGRKISLIERMDESWPDLGFLHSLHRSTWMKVDDQQSHCERLIEQMGH